MPRRGEGEDFRGMGGAGLPPSPEGNLPLPLPWAKTGGVRSCRGRGWGGGKTSRQILFQPRLAQACDS